MGLDMMLYASNGQSTKGSTLQVPAKQNDLCEVAYWRKSNQIHSWFVEHVQDGVDDCKQHTVSRKQLEALRQTCMEALSTENSELITPMPGFFFGSTAIDDQYWNDLRGTVDQLDKVLAMHESFQITYQSSW